MENVINKLSEIESTASKIMEDVNIQKKALAAEMEEKQKAYDAQIDSQTQKELENIRKKLEEKKESELAGLKMRTDNLVKKLDEFFEENHEDISKELFNRLLRM
mgnify:FL=1